MSGLSIRSAVLPGQRRGLPAPVILSCRKWAHGYWQCMANADAALHRKTLTIASFLRILPMLSHMRGEMAEWLKAHDWKSCLRDERNRGSNPRLSASGKLPHPSSQLILVGCELLCPK